MGAFAERMGSITPLAKSARIDYLKLAKGPITATATAATAAFDPEQVEAVLVGVLDDLGSAHHRPFSRG